MQLWIASDFPFATVADIAAPPLAPLCATDVKLVSEISSDAPLSTKRAEPETREMFVKRDDEINSDPEESVDITYVAPLSINPVTIKPVMSAAPALLSVTNENGTDNPAVYGANEQLLMVSVLAVQSNRDVAEPVSDARATNFSCENVAGLLTETVPPVPLVLLPTVRDVSARLPDTVVENDDNDSSSVNTSSGPTTDTFRFEFCRTVPHTYPSVLHGWSAVPQISSSCPVACTYWIGPSVWRMDRIGMYTGEEASMYFATKLSALEVSSSSTSPGTVCGVRASIKSDKVGADTYKL
jgi:hypothetical protein